METIYGWVVEKAGHECFISAATKDSETGEVMCHDLGGFSGSWKARKDGVFFPTVTGDATCSIALDQAIKYAKEHRGE